MDYIENVTFDEINVGDSASLKRVLTREDIQLFAVMSGDVNPAHLDEEYAKRRYDQPPVAPHPLVRPVRPCESTRRSHTRSDPG